MPKKKQIISEFEHTLFLIKEIRMKVRFISLASGSSGNCYYIGTEKYGILIDAGIAVRTIKKGLKEAGINMEMIRAVFVCLLYTSPSPRD